MSFIVAGGVLLLALLASIVLDDAASEGDQKRGDARPFFEWSPDRGFPPGGRRSCTDVGWLRSVRLGEAGGDER